MSAPKASRSQDYGISIDIGTSQITLHLVNIPESRVVEERLIPNPQNKIGLDVITRIAYAVKSGSNRTKMAEIVRQAIAECIQDILQLSELTSDSIDEVIVVGNTVMHHLFHGLSTAPLTKTPYTVLEKDPISTTASALGLPLDVAYLYSPPIVESFVGPDALMLLVASGAHESDERMVSIDVGTNTEVAVCNEGEVWLASAASGPAFEGMSLDCGMPAEEGAIEHVRIRSDMSPDIKVIGGGRPRGLCGSGAISSVAALLDSGILTTSGSINREIRSTWLRRRESLFYYVLAEAKHSASSTGIYLSQMDLRMLQQSKASIFSAVTLLLAKAGLDPSDVERVFLTGAFGTGIDILDAYRIGLFPMFEHSKLQKVRGGAITGADNLLCRPMLRDKVETMCSKIDYVELAGNPEFKQRYVVALPYSARLD
ncbi:MAG: ASKHA domain-containing protein [Candidatus Thorarchaeota archaeon]